MTLCGGSAMRGLGASGLLACQCCHIPDPETRPRDQPQGLPVAASLHMYFDAAFMDAEDPSGVIPYSADGIPRASVPRVQRAMAGS